MIYNFKLSTLTEDEQAVLLYAINAVQGSTVVTDAGDLRLVKTPWLGAALVTSKQFIKPEYLNIIESIEKKLL
jgi:hypothetical protein